MLRYTYRKATELFMNDMVLMNMFVAGDHPRRYVDYSTVITRGGFLHNTLNTMQSNPSYRWVIIHGSQTAFIGRFLFIHYIARAVISKSI